MKKHLLWLSVISLLLGLWRLQQPPTLRVLLGHLDPDTRSILSSSSASFQETPDGFSILEDRAGIEALLRLRKHHCLSRDIHNLNILNSNTTKSAQGEPYRCRDVVVRNGVTCVVELSGDFIQLYDPTHPDANDQGYVTAPNVCLPRETAQQRYHQSRSETYSRAILKIEQAIPDLIIDLPEMPEIRPSGPLAKEQNAITFEEILQAIERQNQATQSDSCNSHSMSCSK